VQAEKAKKEAKRLEKEGREFAREYPIAATGIIGLSASSRPPPRSVRSSLELLADSSPRRLSRAANLLLVAVPSYYAYKNWHLPRWDRRIVSAVAVGLAGIFSLESTLGYFEYQKEHNRRL